jgi:hypothetical protein
VKIGRRVIGLAAVIALCVALAGMASADTTDDAYNEGTRLLNAGGSSENRVGNWVVCHGGI